MTFPRYDAYINSEIEWLRDIPAHWDTCALKRLVSLKSGEAITSEAIEEEGPFPVYGGNGLRGFTDSFTHDGQYVLIGRQGALCGNIKYASGKFWASEHALVASPLRPLETTWLGELLAAMNLNQYSISAAQPGLSAEAIGNLRVPLPPAAERAAVAAFLSYETAKIDVLADEQNRLIELLKEKRQAVISHAVTKGLNPNAPVTDSGVEWLGQVPEHWNVRRLKHVVTHVVDCLHTTPTYDGELRFPAIRTADVDRGVLRIDQARMVSEEVYLERIQRLKPQAGDVLYSREGERFGMAALVPPDVDLCLGQRMMMFRAAEPHVPAYLMWVLNSEAVYQQVLSGTAGATSPHINIGEIINYFVPNPGPAEQLRIAEFLAHETSRIDGLIAQAEVGISLLEERRTALISAVVTGKIDVRGAVSLKAEAA